MHRAIKKNESRAGPTAFLLWLPFLLCLFGTWAWFNTKNLRKAEQYRGTWPVIATNLPGFEFIPELITANEKRILRTRDTFNGRFVDNKAREFRVLYAHWGAETKSSFEGLNHTPDVCWRGSGWISIPMDRSQVILVRFGSLLIPFQCRLFRSPSSSEQELVIWCFIVDGHILNSPIVYKIDEKTGEKYTDRRSGYRFLLDQFALALNRRKSVSHIDYVRLSTSLNDSFDHSIRLLNEFAVLWLTIRTNEVRM